MCWHWFTRVDVYRVEKGLNIVSKVGSSTAQQANNASGKHDVTPIILVAATTRWRVERESNALH